MLKTPPTSIKMYWTTTHATSGAEWLYTVSSIVPYMLVAMVVALNA